MLVIFILRNFVWDVEFALEHVRIADNSDLQNKNQKTILQKLPFTISSF